MITAVALPPRGRGVLWLALLLSLAGAALATETSTGASEFDRARARLEALGYDAAEKEFRELSYRLQAVAEAHPSSIDAAQALWLSAEAARRAAQLSFDASQARIATLAYRRFVERFPEHERADDALFAAARLELGLLGDSAAGGRTLRRLLADYPAGDRAEAGLDLLLELSVAGPVASSGDGVGPASSRPTELLQVRHWVGPGGVQVILDLDGPAELHSTWLTDARSTIGRSTLRLELAKVHVAESVQRKLGEPRDMLVALEVVSRGLGGAVVSIDVEGAGDYEVFTMGERIAVLLHPAVPPVSSAPRIVIDPGHGGKDPGAAGRSKHPEKQVVLDIATRLADELRRRLGAEVRLTRNEDVFMPLEERTAVANVSAADVFISIHANATRRRKVKGVETYFLAAAEGERAKEVAARENGLTEGGAADGVELDAVLSILNDLALQRSVERSSKLARSVHTELVDELVSAEGTEDLGLKQAPFLVLIGAEMPSVLVEVGFLDHREEGKRLATSRYQRRVARAIARGVEAFLQTARTEVPKP